MLHFGKIPKKKRSNLVKIQQSYRKFCQNFAEFSPNVTKFFRDFSKMQQFSKIFKMCNIFLGIFSKICRFFRKKRNFRDTKLQKSDSVNHIPNVLYCRRLRGAWADRRKVVLSIDSLRPGVTSAVQLATLRREPRCSQLCKSWTMQLMWFSNVAQSVLGCMKNRNQM